MYVNNNNNNNDNNNNVINNNNNNRCYTLSCDINSLCMHVHTIRVITAATVVECVTIKLFEIRI